MSSESSPIQTNWLTSDWPEGFVPDPTQPRYVNDAFAQRHFAELVRPAAQLWAQENVKGDAREWIFAFGDWCAERSMDRLNVYKMPSFSKWWRIYYAEPAWSEDNEDDE